MKIKDILLMAAVATAALTGCGIVMYLDSENWLKGSVEYENDEFQHLGISVGLIKDCKKSATI